MFESIFLILRVSDTTSTTLAGAFFYLARNPHWYRKLAKEERKTFTLLKDIRNGLFLRSWRYDTCTLVSTKPFACPHRSPSPCGREVAQGGTPLSGSHTPAEIDIGISIYALYHVQRILHPCARTMDDGRRRRRPGTTRRLWSMGDPEILFQRVILSPLDQQAVFGRTFAMMELMITLVRIFWIADFEAGACGTRWACVGEGSPTSSNPGRRKPHEFQLRVCLTSIPQGPILSFQTSAN